MGFEVAGISAGGRACSRVMRMRWLLRSLFWLALVAHLAGAGAATVQYVYDEAGRLTQVVAPNGDSVRYTYDPAGNIKGIQRSTLTGLSLVEFSPNQGVVGTSVTLFGSGFSATPSSNQVTFNGTPASVTYADTNRLVVTVPAGATTGSVAVTVGSNSVTSAQPFTLLAQAPGGPVVTGFTPTGGPTGTVVTINGSNFDSDRSKNFVSLNGRPVSVSAATASQLTITIPPEASSGRFRIATPTGTVSAAGDFYIAPGGVTEAQVIERGRIIVDGPSISSGVVPDQKVGLYLFDGTAGQVLHLGVSPVSTTQQYYSSVSVQVFSPNGSQFLSAGWTSASPPAGNGFVLQPLPKTGTYVIAVWSSVTNGSAQYSLTLSSEALGTLTADAATPITFASTRPGQNGRFTFDGVAGNSYSLAFSSVTYASAPAVTVYGPNGLAIASGSPSPGAVATPLDIAALPTTGKYSVVVDPLFAGTGQISMLLLNNLTAALGVDGSTVPVSLRAGQNGRLTFNGIAGQRLSIGFSSLTTTPAGGGYYAKVLGPTGAVVWNCNATYYGYTNDESCVVPPLPANGVYTLLLDPQGSSAISLNVALSSELGSVLTPNAATPTTFNAVRPGQIGRYTFTGTAGARYALSLSGVTIPGTWSTVTVLGPNGNQVATANVATGYAPVPIDIPAPALAGTYTVVIDPYRASTGQVTLALRQESEAVLAVDGAAATISLLDGQNARLLFTGTQGQNLGLGFSNLTATPSGVGMKFTVYGPTGALLTACSNGYAYTGSGNCHLPTLPATGTYVVAIDPQGAVTGSVTVTLSSDLVGTLVMDAASPTTFLTTRAGQNGRYTFSGLAGQRAAIAVSSISIPGTWTYFNVLAPNGALLASGYTAPGYTMPTIDFGPLPITGSYTLVIVPNLDKTGQASVRLASGASSGIAVDGAATVASLAAGQNGRYSFTGTEGQFLGLGISAMSTTPVGGSIHFKVVAPNGSDLIACGTFSASSLTGVCKIPRLPASGSYEVVVDPQGINAAAATLTLSNDSPASLIVGARTTTTFTASRVGQNGRFTFDGVAGANYTVNVGNVTIPGAWTYVYVYAPDGTQLGSNYGSSTNAPAPIAITNAPATGTYTVFIAPVAGGVGSLAIGVVQTGVTAPSSQTPNGSLVIDAAGLAINVPSGQAYRYTFAGTQGQLLSLAGDTITTSPANSSVTVTITRPDNVTVLVSCPFAATGFSCNLPALPSTGTYTVRVQPSTGASVSATLYVSTDYAGSLTVDPAAPTLYSSTRKGRNGRFSFAGVMGTTYSVAWSGSTFPTGQSHVISVYKPDGSLLTSQSFSATAGSVDLVNVPASGNYTVLVDPGGASTGQVSLAVRRPATGSVAVNGGAAMVALAAGQDGRYTFTGTAGQYLGLGATAISTTPANGSVGIKVLDPSGQVQTDCGSSYQAWGCNLAVLPQTGTYTLVIDSPLGSSANLTLTLSTDLPSALTLNGAAALFSTTRAGQNGRFTFSGTMGQNVTVAWSGATLSASSTVLVYRPDGTLHLQTPLSSAALDLGDLPATGTYSVVVDPYLGGIGQVSVAVMTRALGTVSVDGAPTAVSLAQGQKGRYSFTAVAGQSLGLAVTGISTVPANGGVSLQVLDSAGTLVLDCGYSSADRSCNIPALAVGGTYWLSVSPPATASAAATLTLSSDVVGSLTPNAVSPTVFASTRAGTNGKYTFTATAGEEYSLVWTDTTIQGTWSFFNVYRPDGQPLQSLMFAQEVPRSVGSLGVIPASGTYTVFVDPIGAKTGSVSIGLTRPFAATLFPNDVSPTAVSLVTGQSAMLTFNGALGGNYGVVLSGLTTSPVAASTNPVLIELLNAAGTVLQSCNAGAADNLSCRFPSLKETGTYRVRISAGPNAMSFSVRLRSTL